MTKEKILAAADKHEDAFAILPSMLIFALVIAGSYVFDFGWGIAVIASLVVMLAYQVVRWALLRNFRKEKLQRHMLETRIACADALDAIQMRGICWAFVTKDPQYDLNCDMCRLQLISLTVEQRFRPVPGVQGKTHAVWMGTFCPGCGCSMKGIKNPVIGDLADVLEYVDERPDVYVLNMPNDPEGLCKLMLRLETSIKQGEAILDAGKKQVMEIRERLMLEELKRSPQGYRVTVEPEPAPPDTQSRVSEALPQYADDEPDDVVRIVQRGNSTIIG